MRAFQTTAFALGALVLSLILSISTYELVRNLAVRSEQATNLRQAYVSASLVNAGLRTSNPNIVNVLSGLEVPSGSTPILNTDNKWYSSSLQGGRSTIPRSLRDLVTSGAPGFQRFLLGRKVEMAVGIPLVATHSYYFELFDLSDTTHMLSLLTYSLLAASILTTVAGAAMGLWTSRKILAPIEQIALAAGEIASGDLDTHLWTDDLDLFELASSFNSMVDALRSRVVKDARFASDVSHELKSPLTTIQNSLQIMEHRVAEMAPPARQAFEMLSEEIGRFDRLVQDLLELASSDYVDNKMSLEPLSPRELLVNCLNNQKDFSGTVDVDPALDELEILADKRGFERIVSNLVDNADKYARGLDRVRAEKHGNHLRLFFEDRGPGISDHDKVRIFDRFARGTGKDRRMAGRGTGLGLSIVQEHVRTLRGSVWVQDRPGGGCSFIIDIPIKGSQESLRETTP